MKTKFKVTSKTTKADLLEVLTANAQNTEGVDQQTVDTAAYAINNPDKATRSDLAKLVKTFMTTLGDKFIVPTFAESESEAETPKPENLVKKTDAKTEEATENSGKSKKKVTPKSTDEIEAFRIHKSDELFPNTIEIEGEVFTLDHGVKTISDLDTEDKMFEFAFYWTADHLRKFPYVSGNGTQPKKFNNDLDTCQLIYVSDAGFVAYAISDATEAFYAIYAGDLEETNGIRYSNGCEFQIYSRPTQGTDSEDTSKEDNEESEEEDLEDDGTEDDDEGENDE